ncbi:hypothetical protein CF166_27585 [Amycolatopsis sp. KNN50.9b]|nr:hypothetical protein CF166_27585 [Amycolatopsis sp. KNN50.9b]
MPGSGAKGRPRVDDRRVINGMLFMAKTGVAWRDPRGLGRFRHRAGASARCRCPPRDRVPHRGNRTRAADTANQMITPSAGPAAAPPPRSTPPATDTDGPCRSR